jgi:hypothetical protein
MLGLKLREEFRGNRIGGTVIELSNTKKTGATQISAQSLLKITYPTRDLLKGIEAICSSQGPVAIVGDRGLGKSHLMAALFHAATNPDSTWDWLNEWADRLQDPQIAKIPKPREMKVISENLNRNNCKYLWDVLFKNHPHGDFIRGKWNAFADNKTHVPPEDLILELLELAPAMLLLDEFQTWYDGLDDKEEREKSRAFGFIQTLSEIAKNHPELLVMAISVREVGSEAYRQVARVSPIILNFKAMGSIERVQQERRNMLQHRLFENRSNIGKKDIESQINVHISEYFRLTNMPPAEQERIRNEFIESWPFAPHLLSLLEEQVLVASYAQETRDLIKILVSLFKSRGDKAPLLTAADFHIEDEKAGIGPLLESVSLQSHRTLRDKANLNISSVQEALRGRLETVPNLKEIVSALWLRSIAAEKHAGAEPISLQLDITRNKPIDDNSFKVELAAIEEHSFNIHKVGPKLLFKEEENPRAKLLAYAHNDKEFSDRRDHRYLAKQIAYAIGGAEGNAQWCRIVVLSATWHTDPWALVEKDEDRPENWDSRIPIIALPERPEDLDASLGPWLKEHLQKQRNTPRFLLPYKEGGNAFNGSDLIYIARSAMLAEEWGHGYRELHNEYRDTLREKLKQRFTRFALLQRWNYTDPSQCRFQLEPLDAKGQQIPNAMQDYIATHLFAAEDFRDLVLQMATNSESVAKLLKELAEPRPAGQSCIPWLGETELKDRLLRLCSKGEIAINVRGDYLQKDAGEDDNTAWLRIRGKLPTGRHLEEVSLLLPSALPSTGGAEPEGGLFDRPVPSPSGQKIPTEATSITKTSGYANLTQWKPCSSPANSPLNHLAYLEAQGIGPATNLQNISLKVSSATVGQLKELLNKLPEGIAGGINMENVDLGIRGANGAQLKDLLKKLPDGMVYELTLQKEDD